MTVLLTTMEYYSFSTSRFQTDRVLAFIVERSMLAWSILGVGRPRNVTSDSAIASSFVVARRRSPPCFATSPPVRAVYRSYPSVATLDDRFVDIDADDLVIAVGETGSNCRSYISTPDETDVHLPARIQLSVLRSLTNSDQFHTAQLNPQKAARWGRKYDVLWRRMDELI
jgi:hypothetical protein